ncbi:MAG: hypothetical protein CVU00_05190 [Bacteroidetes bacterium HGW-Bacteroidetes-17]|jgi:hypothetical protein|nr:MAG: hypothetical protein CVU00_05190 [Bacteroidetes bacterium HGW-Bacteroidetes-17]
MKQIAFLLILFSTSLIISCEKQDDAKGNDFQFEATVRNKRLDCGETIIIELKNISGNSEIADGIYYADNLDSEFKEPGLKIELNCREHNNDEVYACTTMGPTYPHVIVIDSKTGQE